MDKSSLILAIGNMYVETNFISLQTGGSDQLAVDNEYRADFYEVRPGGSAVNFAIQALKFGYRVGLIGKTGADENGQRLKTMLTKTGIATDLIVTDPNVSTGIDSGLVFAHSRKNIQIVSGNANMMMSIDDINLSHPLFTEAKAVYLGGFLKQEHLYPYYPELVRTLKERGIAVFLDHGRIPVTVTHEMMNVLFDTLPYVEGYLPNRHELTTVTGTANVDQALKKALSLGPAVVAVKMDRDGCRAIIRDGTTFSCRGHEVNAVNVVGAGDVFNAGFVTRYLSDIPVAGALEFGNAAAAVRISKNTHPDAALVEDFLSHARKG